MTVLSSPNRSMKLNLLGATVRVVGMIPLRVVEMVPVRVVEMVPVFVVEMVPAFGKATLDSAKINRAEQRVHFRFLIVFSWVSKSSEAAGSLRRLLNLSNQPITCYLFHCITCQRACRMTGEARQARNHLRTLSLQVSSFRVVGRELYPQI